MNSNLVNSLKNTFIKEFQIDPLIIFSPGRINIIGEHTDYNDGFVFPAAVDKGIFAAFGKSDSHTCTVYAIDKNETTTFSLNYLKPMATSSWQNYILGIVEQLQKANKVIGNFNMAFRGTIPEGSGMSSSAALENNVVFGLNELFNLRLTKTEMILISQKAEHEFVGVNCGIMDQYASMFGIENKALLLDCRTLKSEPFEIDFNDHELILINTNVKHSLSESAYNNRRSVCESISKKLNVKALRDVTETDLKKIKNQVSSEDYQKALYIILENERVIQASKAMQSNDLVTLGKLMYASHNGLQNQYKVSCNELNFLVALAKLNHQVMGARMMGGGFGGCTINLIKKSGTEAFKTFVSKAYKAEFNKDCSIYPVKLSNGTAVLKQEMFNQDDKIFGE